MGALGRISAMKKIIFFTLVSLFLVACATNKLLTQPTSIATTTSSPLPFVPSVIPLYAPSHVQLPTNAYTASPEPDIAPNCKIANEEGQLYLLSDKEYHDLFTTGGKNVRTLENQETIVK